MRIVATVEGSEIHCMYEEPRNFWVRLRDRSFSVILWMPCMRSWTRQR